jgi:homoserine dehydrogenase
MRVDFDNPPISAAHAPESPIVVLKFGSSVLRTPADLAPVASEIYRFVREGVKVVAVVSAFAGETDALIAEARKAGAPPQSRHAPRLIAIGEERSAALLAITCEAIGLDVRVLGARALGLTAGGPADDAHPDGVNAGALATELQRRDAVIAPGFVALGASGEPVLLGRGGSDLTAVFLAAALGLRKTTLTKDVEGVFDEDPATAGDSARLYVSLDWNEARSVAGKLLQQKAIDFAASHHVGIEVRRLNRASGTLVSDRRLAPAAPKRPAPLRVAVAGLGLIGGGVAERLAADGSEYALIGALVRDANRLRPGPLAVGQHTTDLEAFLAFAPDVVIDALSDGQAGRGLAEAALSRGVSVITANKQAIAGAMEALTRLARKSGASFACSPSVGGGAPILETVARAREQGRIDSIEAVLNGTVNFILTSVAAGEPFLEAVKKAQIAGFAEPDPSADLSGADVRAKIAILGYKAFGEEIPPGAISVAPLDESLALRFAAEGGAWRQIARLSRSASGEIRASVGFERKENDALFSRALWEDNAARIHLADGRTIDVRGKGAGRKPTVESILGDLGAIRRARLGI